MARERVLEDPSRGLALVHDDIDTHIAGRCGTHELAYFGEQSISVGLVEDDLCSGAHNRRRRLREVNWRATYSTVTGAEYHRARTTA